MGPDWRFAYGNSLGPGECSMSVKKEGPFHLISWPESFLFGHTPDHSSSDIQIRKYHELGSITDCSRHDFLMRGGVTP